MRGAVVFGAVDARGGSLFRTVLVGNNIEDSITRGISPVLRQEVQRGKSKKTPMGLA